MKCPYKDIECLHVDTSGMAQTAECKDCEIKKIDCPECDGKGEVHYSCCGDNVLGTIYEDYDLCPSCKEHLPGREPCETCGGTGEVDESEAGNFLAEKPVQPPIDF